MSSSCSEEEAEKVPNTLPPNEHLTPRRCQHQRHPFICHHLNTEPSIEDDVVPSTFPLQRPFNCQNMFEDTSSDADYVAASEDDDKECNLASITTAKKQSNTSRKGSNKGLNKGVVSSFFVP